MTRPLTHHAGHAVAAALLALASAAALAQAAPRDGVHDFDFHLGRWHTQIHRRVHALANSDEFVDLHGTVTVRKIWDGQAQLEEIEADGPRGHWEGLSVFLYNPGAQQWSQTFANAAKGELTTPLVGGFRDGHGELVSSDTVDGRAVLVRATWSEIGRDAHRFDEAYSSDGGRTWETEFTAHLTREAP